MAIHLKVDEGVVFRNYCSLRDPFDWGWSGWVLMFGVNQGSKGVRAIEALWLRNWWKTELVA